MNRRPIAAERWIRKHKVKVMLSSLVFFEGIAEEDVCRVVLRRIFIAACQQHHGFAHRPRLISNLLSEWDERDWCFRTNGGGMLSQYIHRIGNEAAGSASRIIDGANESLVC